TSDATLVEGDGPPDAFRLPDVADVAVVTERAQGKKCARSWKISSTVGSDPQFPDVTPRDAKALREWEAARKAAKGNRERSSVRELLSDWSRPLSPARSIKPPRSG